MAEYLLTLAANTVWKTDLDKFPDDLLSIWKPIEISFIEDMTAAFSLEWQHTTSNGLIVGQLGRDESTVYLDGSIDDCAEFAIWYRQYVPDDEELTFYDYGSKEIKLSQSTTVEWLIDQIE